MIKDQNNGPGAQVHLQFPAAPQTPKLEAVGVHGSSETTMDVKKIAPLTPARLVTNEMRYIWADAISVSAR